MVDSYELVSNDSYGMVQEDILLFMNAWRKNAKRSGDPSLINFHGLKNVLKELPAHITGYGDVTEHAQVAHRLPQCPYAPNLELDFSFGARAKIFPAL